MWTTESAELRTAAAEAAAAADWKMSEKETEGDEEKETEEEEEDEEESVPPSSANCKTRLAEFSIPTARKCDERTKSLLISRCCIASVGIGGEYEKEEDCLPTAAASSLRDQEIHRIQRPLDSVTLIPRQESSLTLSVADSCDHEEC